MELEDLITELFSIFLTPFLSQAHLFDFLVNLATELGDE
jgi:hypothetical protein